LADVIARLLSDPDLRASMGTAGRHRAVALFSESAYSDAVLRVYRSVLSDRAASAAQRGVYR
jgi:glycosyltransferase involved in cell wall biosynthesis